MQQPAGERPARIVFVNRERVVLPLSFRVVYADAAVEDHKLPVELWAKSDRVSVTLKRQRKVREVRIDADNYLPDVDRKNNVWTAED